MPRPRLINRTGATHTVDLVGNFLGPNIFHGNVNHEHCKSFFLVRQNAQETSDYCGFTNMNINKNQRGKKDCAKLPVCAWNAAGKGGGRCDAIKTISGLDHDEL